MLSRGFCDLEKSKVLVKSSFENRKPTRDGYICAIRIFHSYLLLLFPPNNIYCEMASSIDKPFSLKRFL